eukprot:958275-Pyramimonas_sp.AAC.1
MGDTAAKGAVSCGVSSSHCPTRCSQTKLKDVGPVLQPGMTPDPRWKSPALFCYAKGGRDGVDGLVDLGAGEGVGGVLAVDDEVCFDPLQAVGDDAGGCHGDFATPMRPAAVSMRRRRPRLGLALKLSAEAAPEGAQHV